MMAPIAPLATPVRELRSGPLKPAREALGSAVSSHFEGKGTMPLASNQIMNNQFSGVSMGRSHLASRAPLWLRRCG